MVDIEPSSIVSLVHGLPVFPGGTYQVRLRALEGCNVSSTVPSRVQERLRIAVANSVLPNKGLLIFKADPSLLFRKSCKIWSYLEAWTSFLLDFLLEEDDDEGVAGVLPLAAFHSPSILNITTHNPNVKLN